MCIVGWMSKDPQLYVFVIAIVFFVGMSNFFIIPPENKPMKIRKVVNHNKTYNLKKTPPKPTMFVLTTGQRSFKEPPWAEIVYVHGSHWSEAIGRTYDEGWGKQKWPEGAKRISEGFVTIWKLVSKCSETCFVSEDDAIWPWGEPPQLPKQGFVSFFKEAVCDQATDHYSSDFRRVIKSVVPGKCMPYGAVAHAMTPEFATMLLDRLPMEVPVDHYLWKQAVSFGHGYVSQRYIVYHKKGPSLRKRVNKGPQISKAVAAVVHILTTGSRDIANLLRLWPNAHIFKGSVGYDQSCKNILQDIGVRFKERYYGTLDYIEEGKLGHWCSNLRFARMCHGICVLIEDDIVLSNRDVLKMKEAINEKWSTPVLAVGPSGDTINVWNGSDTERVFEAVRTGIDNPTDIFFRLRHFYTERRSIGRLKDRTNSDETSIIRSMLKKIKLVDLNMLTGLRIAIGIPTYNRAGYVKLCALALKNTLPSNDVWIFDDHSSDYNALQLKEWFGTEHVHINQYRFGPDKNARNILEWFLRTDYDWLVTLDSDLIVRPDWLTILKTLLPKTQGVISVYHSGNNHHPTLDCGQNLCEMKTLGNAGITWSKPLAKKMLAEMKDSHSFDWGWTHWLQKKNIKQYVPKDSLVLHIGMHGTWGADSKREKSMRFDIKSLTAPVRTLAQKYLKGHSP